MKTALKSLFRAMTVDSRSRWPPRVRNGYFRPPPPPIPTFNELCRDVHEDWPCWVVADRTLPGQSTAPRTPGWRRYRHPPRTANVRLTDSTDIHWACLRVTGLTRPWRISRNVRTINSTWTKEPLSSRGASGLLSYQLKLDERPGMPRE